MTDRQAKEMTLDTLRTSYAEFMRLCQELRDKGLMLSVWANDGGTCCGGPADDFETLWDRYCRAVYKYGKAQVLGLPWPDLAEVEDRRV